MSQPFRPHANSYPHNEEFVPPAEMTDNSDNSSGMSSLTNEQMLIKTLRLENETLSNSTSKQY